MLAINLIYVGVVWPITIRQNDNNNHNNDILEDGGILREPFASLLEVPESVPELRRAMLVLCFVPLIAPEYRPRGRSVRSLTHRPIQNILISILYGFVSLFVFFFFIAT